MAEPKIVTPTALTTHALPYTTNANNLKEQADRAVIDSPESLANAVDFLKICGSQHNSAEDARKALTAPLNTHIKWINDQFRPITDLIAKAKKAMNTKATDYQKKERDRIVAEEEAARKLAEDEALEQATLAAESGDTEKAEAIVQAAADTPQGTTKPAPSRGGMTGASGGLRGRWIGEVVDVKQVCAAIASGDLPEEMIKEFSKTALNTYAKQHGEELSKAAVPTKFGLKLTLDESMTVR